MDNQDAIEAGKLLQQLAETLVRKNADYGSSYKRLGPIMDNMFPGGEPVISGVQGYTELFMLYRILDKLNRIANLRFTAKKDSVGEKVEDTLMDAAGYLALWAGMLKGDQDAPGSAYRMLTESQASPIGAHELF